MTTTRIDWKPLKTERIMAKSKLMFKLLNKMGPKALTNLFTFKSEISNYKLRDVESTLCLPQPDSPPVAFKYKYL
jgi:hypothetical protein